MGKKRGKRSLEDPEKGAFTFGDMLRIKGVQIPREGLPDAPPTEKASNTEEPEDINATTHRNIGADLRLRVERKGRGGKTVTIIEGLALRGKERDAFTKRLRRAMGSGANFEGENIVVQGDIRDRLQPWLEKEGASNVRCI